MSELWPLRVAVCLDGSAGSDLEPAAAGLLRRFAASRLAIQRGQSPAGLRDAQVVVAASRTPLTGEDRAAVTAHLARGGGLVLLGRTLDVWGDHPALGEAAVPTASWGPETELRVRPVPGSLFAARLDEELAVTARPRLHPPPPGAEPLLVVPWRGEEVVAGFRWDAGGGHVVHLGLDERALLTDAGCQQLVHRALLGAAAVPEPAPVGVGLLGFGAIAREHAESAVATQGLELRHVCDRSPARRAAAEAFDVPMSDNLEGLLQDPSVEIVVVGLPPSRHPDAVRSCLRAGRHVVCEKPLALRAQDADLMVQEAEDAGRVLTVYQNRRWDADYVALRRAIEDGCIGAPFYLESFIGGYSHPCSYWHSHQPVSGGTAYDWGSHYLDWALGVLPGRVSSVMGAAHKRVWHDVTNDDQIRIDLSFEGGEQATFLHSDIAAAAKPKWYLLGTTGAITADWRTERVVGRAWTGDLVEERLAPAEAPADLTVHRPTADGQHHRERLALAPRMTDGFYRNLADHLLAGEPLAVPARDAARTVALLDAATRSAAAGGELIRVRV
ncbi:MAG: Gfo/Idh/MocA family oxidoreductase [bacterium]|jgi:predicted dehydrogenase|nr:Gfo/Idh/MocA family oxidoreductase [bacterium]